MDSVFTEVSPASQGRRISRSKGGGAWDLSPSVQDLDQEAAAAVHAEKSVTSDISRLLQNRQQFAAAFDEEANFCAGATQVHTHSPTYVKYGIRRQGRKRELCRFKGSS